MKIDKEVFRNTVLLIRSIDSVSQCINKALYCEVNRFNNPIDNLLYSIEKFEGYRWSDEVYDWIYDDKIKTTDLYDKIDEYQKTAEAWEKEKWKYSISSIIDMEDK